MQTKHLIITRFNVASPGREAAIRLKRGWLDERFKLFEEICLPSVAAQTEKNFKWVVFFDVDTPVDYRERIDKLVVLFPFHPVFTDSFDMRKLGPDIVKNYGPADFLLTSRLDSDDILAANYVEILQKIASDLNGRNVINFDNGAILLLNKNKPALYEYHDDSNPFSSLIESFGTDSKTIWGVQHTDIHELGDVVHVQGKPMWLQVVHGGNVSNRVRGRRVPIGKYRSDFNYTDEVSVGVNESVLELLYDKYVCGAIRRVREYIRSIVKFFYKLIFK
ncbi:MAG: glycosyltransferase [Azonexus sp.]